MEKPPLYPRSRDFRAPILSRGPCDSDEWHPNRRARIAATLCPSPHIALSPFARRALCWRCIARNVSHHPGPMELRAPPERHAGPRRALRVQWWTTAADPPPCASPYHAANRSAVSAVRVLSGLPLYPAPLRLCWACVALEWCALVAVEPNPVLRLNAAHNPEDTDL